MPALIVRITAIQCFSLEQYQELEKSCHVLFHEQQARFRIIHAQNLTSGHCLSEDSVRLTGIRTATAEVSNDAFVQLEPGQQLVWVYAKTSVVCRLNHAGKWLRLRKYQFFRPYNPWFYLGSDELEELKPFDDHEIPVSRVRRNLVPEIAEPE